MKFRSQVILRLVLSCLVLGAALTATCALLVVMSGDGGHAWGAQAAMVLAYPSLVVLAPLADVFLEGGLPESPVAGNLIIWLSVWMSLSGLSLLVFYVGSRLRAGRP